MEFCPVGRPQWPKSIAPNRPNVVAHEPGCARSVPVLTEEPGHHGVALHLVNVECVISCYIDIYIYRYIMIYI
jgi:hypothetical protein